MNLFNRNDKSGDRQQTQTSQQPQASQPSQPQAATPPAQQAQQPKVETAAAKPAAPAAPTPQPPSAKTGAKMASVISKALKITGQLESTEDIQIDGQIEGDVRGVGVKIGQNAKVKGTVYGDEVELSGSIEGKIEAKKVVLNGTARMTGDILHQEIKVEAGAYISGTLTPELGKSESKPALKPVASSASVSPITH
jgi:cytoskeletal protein CcmA (bactofilin family)